MLPLRPRQTAEYKLDRANGGTDADVCDNLAQSVSQLVDSEDGEMSEWLKEHAWKTIVVTLAKRY